MRPDSTFTFSEEPCEMANATKVAIYVSDDTATDQDVLKNIQTESDYKNRRLIQLDEVSPGAWVAFFRN